LCRLTRLAVNVMRRRKEVRAAAVVKVLLKEMRRAKEVKSAESRVGRGGVVSVLRLRARLRAQPSAVVLRIVDVSSRRSTMVEDMRSHQ